MFLAARSGELRAVSFDIDAGWKKRLAQTSDRTAQKGMLLPGTKWFSDMASIYDFFESNVRLLKVELGILAAMALVAAATSVPALAQ